MEFPMTLARLVSALVVLPGLFISAYAVAGLDLAGPFGILDPGVGFHTTDVGARLGFGITGGVMVGWGLTLDAMLAGHAHRTVLLRGAVSWFVLDSTASITSGMWPNVLLNAVFFLGLLALAFRTDADRPVGEPLPA
jgi:hypothetical protein